MNCNGFEAMIDDLAKSVLMDASQRDDALAHATSCERCQMRLTDERVLPRGFVSLRRFGPRNHRLKLKARCSMLSDRSGPSLQGLYLHCEKHAAGYTPPPASQHW